MLRRLLRELPLLVGVAVGCLGMWWKGRAFVPMDWPAGFDWERYLRETWAYFNPGTMNSTWLEPLYSYMLGSLGNAVGWAWAGMLISSAGVLLLVLGSGLLGRAMAGPWVGAVAAMSIPLTPNLAAASRWVNVYPALSGATAMGLACMVAMTRWPRFGWALSGGVFVGLAWALDGRTVPLLPGFVLLGVVGASGVSSMVRRGLLLATVLAGMSVGPWAQSTLRVVPRESTEQVAEILRGIELSKLRVSPNASLQQACLDEPSEVINLPGLFRPCAHALSIDNAGRVDEGLPFGLWLTLGFLPFALLPGALGRRQALAAVLAFGPFVGMTLIMSRWIIVTPRYMLQLAAPAAVIVPLGLWQLWRTLGRKPALRRWAAIGPLVALAWLWRGGPEHTDSGPLEHSSTYKMMAPIVTFIEDEVGPDDVLLDCSESHIEVAVLPRTTHGWPSNHEGHDWERCAGWLQDPEGEGTAHIVIGNRTQIPGVRGLSLPPPWTQSLRTDGQGQTLRVWTLTSNFNRAP